MKYVDITEYFYVEPEYDKDIQKHNEPIFHKFSGE